MLIFTGTVTGSVYTSFFVFVIQLQMLGALKEAMKFYLNINSKSVARAIHISAQ